MHMAGISADRVWLAPLSIYSIPASLPILARREVLAFVTRL
jgi:hypothetical protein